ncbi:DtxR family transcriptional regulator [Haloferax sp. Atlit-6N]|jgi:DtxR family Mn-dependent transcriptional regulator|uniref:metal-dependent transcriptional regulator n=1 Tax=Haloferax sp. Atlit-6N TaxID=2077205 RepID=UPI000E22A1F8|nr:metal-dependent transcriptional regulator [Haloferax sp. Atlit-6N]REA00962.1 DtxR family transcriptional regulator [Haloferax sp. Atlit-6N]
MVSPKVEDYLKTIYDLQDHDTRVAPSAIATAMGVKPPTVTTMLQRMHDDGFVDYEPYQGARLTARGEQRALTVVRHHRLLELFLTEQLGYDWSDVHDEADALEHYVSEKLEARLETVLENPTVDPHGAPIPTGDLTVQRDSRHQSVAECKTGDIAAVSEVRDSNPAVLDYLSTAGVALGTRLEVTEIAPFGMVTLEVIETREQFSLPTEIAADVFVSPCNNRSNSETGQFSEVR